MKRFLWVSIFFMLISSGVFAQGLYLTQNENQEYIENYDISPEAARERRFSLQTSPFHHLINIIAFGVGESLFALNLEGQYKISDLTNISLEISFFIDRGWYSQAVIKPMVILRPFRTGLEGFYVGFYSNLGWVRETTGWFTQRRIGQFGLGFNTGYKWVFDNGFTLQLGTGLGRTFNNDAFFEILNADGRLTLPRFDFQILDLKIGFSF